MDDRCANCARLEIENQRLRDEIDRLQARLEAIRRYCVEVRMRTQVILGQRNGVPFGKWKYAEGADGVAQRVQKIAG